jgi:hypothetical protein
LGVFTRDLAQELDVSARAVDLVADYARGERKFSTASMTMHVS